MVYSVTLLLYLQEKINEPLGLVWEHSFKRKLFYLNSVKLVEFSTSSTCFQEKRRLV